MPTGMWTEKTVHEGTDENEDSIGNWFRVLPCGEEVVYILFKP
jgi:hypothetical protein